MNISDVSALDAQGNRPSVSVVVPTRDRPALLRRALHGVLHQRYAGSIECVVVFDQSRPHHLSLDTPPGRSIRVVVNERTPGLAGSRNMGAATSTGELIAFCDDDDAWHPQKLEDQVRAFRSHPAWTAVACGIVIENDGRLRVRIPPRPEVMLSDLLRSRVMEVNASTLVARRSDFFETIGPVDEAIPGSYAEDYEWLLRAARRGPIGVVPRPLVLIRWHGGSWFAQRWDTVVDALGYLLAKHPELHRDPRGLARILGQLAFAHAAAGNRGEARRWALRTVRSSWREGRGYIALAVGLGVLQADTVTRLARSVGRGI